MNFEFLNFPIDIAKAMEKYLANLNLAFEKLFECKLNRLESDQNLLNL